jgi:hypothetical protein
MGINASALAVSHHAPTLHAWPNGADAMARWMSALACILLLPLPAEAEWRRGGDLRAGYFSSEREARNGEHSDDDATRLRLRLFVERDAGPAWKFRMRVAGRYGTDQESASAFVRGHAPTRSGTRLGDTTLDEFHLTHAPPGADWTLRLGRFQSKFELMGVAAKSLDRNDSTNIDVTWTDGMHLQYRVNPDWRAHLVLQHNHRRGSSSTTRAPLDFSDSGSRVSMFAGLEAIGSSGPVVQRMLGLSWWPSALARDGVAASQRSDFVALTARGALAWPAGEGDRRWLLAAEAGHAPTTPRGRVVGTGSAAPAGGNAWQVSANLEHLRPGHHVGVVYGRVDAGWLISPDLRNNDELAEVRYQWQLRAGLSMEARYRWRQELDVPATAEGPRVDRDVYLRVSARF